MQKKKKITYGNNKKVDNREKIITILEKKNDKIN